MRVFITGATGYVGFAVAAALARAGHHVVGLARSPAKANMLAAAEVVPVLGSMDDPLTYAEAARESQVLIHCAAEYSARYMELDRQTIDHLLALASQAKQPRLFLYTSGVWVYGATGDDVVDEASALRPPAMVAARAEHEQLVLRHSSGAVRTLVIRPGCVYGGSGSLTAGWFDSAVRAGAARVIGDGSYRWSMVHLQDLADLFVRAAQSPWAGQVFNATDRSRFTVLQCAQAASRAAGRGGKVEVMPMAEASRAFGPMTECLVLDQHVDSSKAVRWLGWQPRHGGFVDGVAQYFVSWKASQKAG